MTRAPKSPDAAVASSDRAAGALPGAGRFVVGLLIGGLLLLLLLRRVDLQAVMSALGTARWPLLLLLPPMSYLSIYLKAWRWSVALGAGAADRPRRRLFSASLIGTAANTVLPARLGDVLRALVLHRHNPVSIPRALLAGLAAQAFDMLAVGLLLLAFVATDESVASRRALVLILAALVAGLAIAGGMARRPRTLIGWASRLPFGLGARAAHFVEHASAGLQFLSLPAVLARVVGLTALIWIGDLLATMLALRAFRIDVGFAAASLLLGSIGLSFALPLTPGNLGTYQLVAVLVLGRVGVEADRALAFGIGSQGIGWLGTLLPGLIVLQRERLLSWGALRAASRTKATTPEPDGG